MIGFFMVLAVCFVYPRNAAGTVRDDERLDRETGLLDHPWRIFLPQNGTLDYLRRQTGNNDGLPFFAQQPEGAGFIPGLGLPEVMYSSGTGQPDYPDASGPDNVSIMPGGGGTGGETTFGPGYQFTPTGPQLGPQFEITEPDYPSLFDVPGQPDQPR